jgi:hypothetical protein
VARHVGRKGLEEEGLTVLVEKIRFLLLSNTIEVGVQKECIRST